MNVSSKDVMKPLEVHYMGESILRGGVFDPDELEEYEDSVENSLGEEE